MVMLTNRPCSCAGVAPTIVMYDDGTVPPVVGNRVTLERPAPTLQWAGVAGPGIGITYRRPDNDSGHQPAIRVMVSPYSDVPIGFDQAGRLQVGPIDFATLQTPVIINGAVPIQGGVEVVQGGVLGHAVTVAVKPSVASGSSRVWIGADGGLSVDPPLPFVWAVVDAAGNTRTLKLTNTLTGASITLGTV